MFWLIHKFIAHFKLQNVIAIASYEGHKIFGVICKELIIDARPAIRLMLF